MDDLADGRYRLTWTCRAAGSFQVDVEVGGDGKSAEPISGSPIPLVFEAAAPDLSQAEVILGSATGEAVSVNASAAERRQAGLR